MSIPFYLYGLFDVTHMNQLFRCIPLPYKLSLIAVIPLAFTVFLTVQLLNERKQNLHVLDGYRQYIESNQVVIQLSGELQTELRLSYLHTLGNNQSEALVQQRAVNDSIISVLEKSNDPSFSDFTSYTFLSELPKMRAQVDSGVVAPQTVTSFYINAIYRLHSMSSTGTIKHAYFDSMNREISGQKLLAQMINFYGIMRLNIYNVLYTKENALGTLYGLRGVYDIYRSFEKEFQLHGSPAATATYKKLRQDSHLQKATDYIDRLFSNYAFDSSYNADSWWKDSQLAISEMKGIRNDGRTAILSRLGQYYQDLERNRDRSLFLLVSCLLAIAAIVTYNIVLLNKMLNEIRAAAQKISAGAIGVAFKPFPNDVIGKLAKSIEKLDHNNKLMAETAAAIGKGDFSVPVHMRSSEDILGQAIMQMRDDLKRFTEEQKQKQQQISRAILSGQEKERTRIGEELHDNINQLLTSVLLYLNYMESDTERRDELLPKSRSVLNIAIEEIRQLTRHLVLPGLRDDTLAQSIQNLVDNILETSSIRFNLDIVNIEERDLSDELKLNVFRIIQEQLKNIIKYAAATKVSIRLERYRNELRLSIDDNGKGFDTGALRKGSGIANIYSRAETFNGIVEISSAVGKGCSMKVILETTALQVAG